jgi:transcriptional regulator with XRE-family HTH domain
VPEELKDAVAAEIRRLVADRNLSGRALAQRTGIPQRSLARKLAGVTAFDLNDLQVLAEVLGVRVTDLVSWAESSD